MYHLDVHTYTLNPSPSPAKEWHEQHRLHSNIATATPRAASASASAVTRDSKPRRRHMLRHGLRRALVLEDDAAFAPGGKKTLLPGW